MESKILKLVEKYNVEIELKYKKDTIIAIIDDGDEPKIVKCGWIKNLIEIIENECKIMFTKQKEKNKDLMADLFKRANDKEIFPDDLFCDITDSRF